jgi:preprotein translocase subunit SecD
MHNMIEVVFLDRRWKMIQLLAALIVTTGTPTLSDEKSPPPAKIEFRRAETEAGEGLIEANDPTNSDKVYLHKKVELDNKDIASAFLDFNPQKLDFIVHVTFTEEGAKKMGALTKQLLNKRLAILLDGKVISAPMITGEFSKNAMIQKLKKEDAERIAKAFGGK